ncbi:hypothetical protein F5878DRAFT_604637 [Lentinula raphanica]|uniref:DUF6699 domain-containing protein n=1 Tax=Lentinula raphanica TaxID=153919 RepID=A0AA38PIE1_9AGAR|nr:hypothetical protein F5878DRAFT_604637 [Lentinula raphanica]
MNPLAGPIPYTMRPTADHQLSLLLLHSHFSPPAVDWDMTSNPLQTARFHPAWNHFTWNAPATNPAVPHMVVKYGVWEIKITPRPTSTCSYVTVLDVLYGIYRYLRRPSSPQDLRVLPPDQRSSVTDAYNRRWQRCPPGFWELEWQKGLKYIDFLADTTSFWGLSPTEEPRTWKIEVSRLYHPFFTGHTTPHTHFKFRSRFGRPAWTGI